MFQYVGIGVRFINWDRSFGWLMDVICVGVELGVELYV